MIFGESGGRKNAMRYEGLFFREHLDGKSREDLLGHVPSERLTTLVTELRLRATSFGLMQLLGETMRERGFASDDLGDLLEPEVNIMLGCSFLHDLYVKRGNTERAMLLGFNGGGNKQYPDYIFKIRDSGRCDFLLN